MSHILGTISLEKAHLGLQKTCRYAAIIVASAAVIVAFVRYYVRHEEPLYYWDYAAYWNQYRAYGALLEMNHAVFFRRLWRSIRYSSYSGYPVLPLMPIYLVFKGSRIVYISAVSVVYLIPASLIISRISTHSIPDSRSFRFPTVFVIAILFPPFWAPTLRGYLSIGGLITLGLAVQVIISTQYLTKARLVESASVGFLLWATFLFRRWYAPAVIGVLFTSVCFSVASAWRKRDQEPATVQTLYSYAIVAAVGVSCGLAFQAPLLLRILHTSYSGRYIAYSAPFSHSLYVIYKNLGLATTTIIFWGILYAGRKERYSVTFTAIAALSTLVVFSSIQTPGLQQQLPEMFLLFPAYIYGLHSISRAYSSKYVTSGLLLWAMAAFAASFLLYRIDAWEGFRTLMPEAYPPLRIAQFGHYVALDNELRALPKGSRFSVFAASPYLNSSLLVAINPKLEKTIRWESDIDARDHFRWADLDSKFVVVGDPVQTQFRPQYQRVIWVPATEILEHKGVGVDFVRYGQSEQLAHGVIGQIYKRIKKVSSKQINGLANQFYRYYPSWRRYDKRSIAMALASSSQTIGARWGTVRLIGKRTIMMSPGINSDTSVRFSARNMGHLDRLVFKIPRAAKAICPQMQGVNVEVTENDGIIFKGAVQPGARAVANLGAHYAWVKIAVAPIRRPDCDWLHVRFE